MNLLSDWLPLASVFYRLSNPFSGVSGSSAISASYCVCPLFFLHPSCSLLYVFTQPLHHEQDVRQSIFLKQSLTVLNSEFLF